MLNYWFFVWRDKQIKFLTQNKFDEAQIINVLKQDYSKLENHSERKILQAIIHDFETKKFSLLRTQEIQYLLRNSQKKWTPYLIHRYKFRFYEGNQQMPDFPFYLILEPVSSCNLRCPFCMQVDKKFTSNQEMMGMMDLDLFKKIIDEAYESGTQAVTLTGRGEPTIHPQLGEMLEYCSGKFIEFKMNTNATLLNEKLIHQILKSDITDLVFSVDSYYKEEFESLRVNANFEKVVENIKKFKNIKDEFYPNSSCITRASGVQVSEKQDVKKFEKFWKEYVDFVVMVRMIHRWDLYNNTQDVAATTPCHYLGRNLSIYFDGTVNPCDIDYEGKLSVGSVKDSTIHDLWKGKKYRQIFDAHKNNNRQNYFPCDRCPVGA
jgi:radical SAM protein with 4Fe4S-binding SPASM domain